MKLSIGFDNRQTWQQCEFWQVAVVFGDLFRIEGGRLVRLSIQSFKRWARSAESGIGRNMDNYGPVLYGFHIWRLVNFRYYRRIAAHVSLGPVTLSWVRDSWPPVSNIWPASHRKGVR